MNQLAEKPLSEVHIRLSVKDIEREEALLPLKERISSQVGNCALYFHVPVDGAEFVIKTAAQMRTSAKDAHISELKNTACVEDVWAE